MKRVQPRKLALSRETVRRLAGEQLKEVAGGAAYYTYDCTAGCQPCTSGNRRCTCPSFV